MDKRMELVDALLDLSRASARVAKLVSAGGIDKHEDDLILTKLGDSQQTLDLATFYNWPPAKSHTVPFSVNLEGLSVLEWSVGGVSVSSTNPEARRIDVITDDYAKAFNGEQPPNVRVINQSETRSNYDIGIVWETAEFLEDPSFVILLMAKHCRTLHIRFRPWSGRDGAFMSDTLNRAFSHLAMDMEHRVKFKVIRPLATYEALLKKTGLTIHERRINTTQPDAFFLADAAVMKVLKERTWGEIDTDQALKIMATDSVDFVLGYSP